MRLGIASSREICVMCPSPRAVIILWSDMWNLDETELVLYRLNTFKKN